MLVCHAALPALKQAGRGTIVNIASGAALRPLEQRARAGQIIHRPPSIRMDCPVM